MRVLFVCAQNTCRSPMLKCVFENYLAINNIKDITCDSAGVMSFGEGINKTAAKVLLREGISYGSFKSKACDFSLLQWADIAFAMSVEQAQYLQYFATSNGINIQIVPLSEVCGYDIEDPFEQGDDTYQALLETFKEISPKIYNFLI